MTVTGLLNTMPHVRAGRLKVLGVGHTQRINWASDLPAINETIPGYYNTGWWGLVAPKYQPAQDAVTKAPHQSKATCYARTFVIDAIRCAHRHPTPAFWQTTGKIGRSALRTGVEFPRQVCAQPELRG